MREMIVFVALLGLICLAARLGMDADYARFKNKMRGSNPEHLARLKMYEVAERRFGHFTQKHISELKNYVLAMTHNSVSSHWFLSSTGLKYLTEALQQNKSIEEIANEIPNPVPEIYLNKDMLDRYHHSKNKQIAY